MMKTSTIPPHITPFFPTSTSYIKYIAAILTLIASSTFSTTKAQDPHPGEALFKTKCSICHGQNGEGIAVFPPLTESEWVNGPAENLIKIQLRGLTGPITVKGKEYNGMMPANATMTDQEIADVLTYVRSNMGNKAEPVTPDTVKLIRAEMAGKTTPLTVADLIDPVAAAPVPDAKSEKEILAEEKAKEDAKKAAQEKKNAQAKAKAERIAKRKAQAKQQAQEKAKAQEAQAKAEASSKPATATPAPAAAASTTGPHPGKAIYQAKCIACHGPTGDGVPPAFPPLAGSEWVNGPAENLIKIQLHGLKGPIEVKGTLYNMEMPHNAAMNDQDIAHVLTYIRSSMGNTASAVTPDMVKAHRNDTNGTPITVKDLIDPNTPPPGGGLKGDTELTTFKPAEHNSSGNVIFWALGIIGICTLPAAAGLVKN